MKSPMPWFRAMCFLPAVLIPCTVLCWILDIWCASSGDLGVGTGTVIKGPNGTVVLFDEGGGAAWAADCKNVPFKGGAL